jgi:glycosyltransferase involved in cell wall biosynthesis
MTNQIPKISIVIPSFNKVRYIGQTLESIVNQKYQNLEIIIQDGGSTDGTVGIIKEYAQKYPKVIRFESKKDNGQLDAINKGMKRADGEILTYINADDVYTQGAFSEVTRLYSANPGAYWFAGKGKVIDSSGKEIAKTITWYKNLLLSLNSIFYLLVTNYFMQPSVFITRKVWKEFGPFMGTSDFVMEYDLWLKMARRQTPVISKKYLSEFRIEPSTITKNMSKRLLSEDEKIVRKYTSNNIVLFLHALHNYGRRLIGGIV